MDACVPPELNIYLLGAGLRLVCSVAGCAKPCQAWKACCSDWAYGLHCKSLLGEGLAAEVLQVPEQCPVCEASPDQDVVEISSFKFNSATLGGSAYSSSSR